MQHKAPDIFQYLDLRKYLKDYYEFRKQSDHRFSYTKWSEDLGLKSRSQIRLIVTGRRKLSHALAQKLASSIPLNKAQLKYLEMLTRFNQARSISEREDSWKQLLVLLGKKKSHHVRDSYKLLFSQWTPRILTLLDLKDQSFTAEKIAKVLGLNRAQVEESLNDLSHLGLAYLDGDRWKGTGDSSSFFIEDELGHKALQSFHRKSFQEAMGSISLNPHVRFFNAALMVINSQEYEEIISEINEFTDYLCQKYKRDHGSQKTLYQLSLAHFPVGKRME